MPFFTLILTKIKRKPAYPFVDDKWYKSMESNSALTFKTKNALDPTTLLLGIYLTDTLPHAQNSLQKDASYSTVYKCKLTKKTQLSTSRKPTNKSHYIHFELYAVIYNTKQFYMYCYENT